MVQEREPDRKEPLKFPQFPTLFSEEEQQRLKEIEEQRKRLSEVYQAKFTPEAQAKMFPLERFARKVISQTALAPIVEAITPWRWGWDFGMTPELYRAESDKLELEYKALARKQQVTDVLPLIQETLRNLALIGEDVGVKEFAEKFKLVELGFNKEEIDFVIRYAMDTMEATPEQLVSGEGLGIRPVNEDEMDYLRASLPPRHIQTVISLSQNVADITAALQEKYAPQVEDDFDTQKGRITKAYTEMIRSTGVELGEGESLTEASQRAYEKIVEQLGEPLILSDDQTGEMIVARKKTDGTVWVGDELIGSFDPEQQTVVPISPLGIPLKTEEQKESMWKDWLDDIRFSYYRTSLTVRQWALTSVPAFLNPVVKPISTDMTDEQILERKQGLAKIDPTTAMMSDEQFIKIMRKGAIDPEVAKALERQSQEMMAFYEEDYRVRRENEAVRLEELIKTHPELAPRPDWEEPVFDRLKRNPREVLDMGYLGHQIFSNIDTYLAMVATIGVYFATKSPFASTVVATILFTPLEGESLNQDLMDSGASFEQAAQLSVPAGAFIASLESIGNFQVLKAVAPQFFAAFRRNYQREVSKTLVKRMIESGIVVPTKIWVAEILIEETSQEIAHNAFVKTVDENRGLFDNVPEVIVQGTFQMAPLFIAGGGANYIQMKRYLPKKASDKLDKDSQTLQDEGIPEEQADLMVYNKLVETEEGQAQVEIAVEKADEVVEPVVAPEVKLSDEALASEIDAWNRVIIELGKLRRGEGMSDASLDFVTGMLEDIDIGAAEIKKISVEGISAEQAIDLDVIKIREEIKRLEETRLLLPKLPAAEAMPSKITNLETKLTTINSDIDTFTNSVKLQEDRLSKLTLPFERAELSVTIEGLQEQLSDLEAKKAGMVKRLGKLRKPVVAPEVTEPVIRDSEVKIAYDRAMQSLPEDIRSELDNVVKIGTANLEGRGGNVVELKNRLADIVVDKSEPDLMEIVRHELLHAYLLKHPEKITDQGFFGVENTIRGIEKEITKLPVAKEPAAPIVPSVDEELTLTPENREALRHIAEMEAHKEELPLFYMIPDLTSDLSQVLPRLPDLGTEIGRLEGAIDANPDIKKLTHENKDAKNRKILAEKALSNLHKRLEETKTEKAKEPIREEFKKKAKDSGIRYKKLLVTSWDDLTPVEQSRLALAEIPDHSLPSYIFDQGRDTVLVYSSMEKHTGQPFLHYYDRIIGVYTYALRLKGIYLKELTAVPKWKKIVRNSKKMEQVALIIESRRPGSKVKIEPPVTEEELLMVEVADAMAERMKKWEPVVRFLRFLRAYEDNASVDAIVERFKEGESIRGDLQLAKDILERGDEDALFRFLKTKTWGIIGSGYSHWRIFNPDLEVTEPTWTSTRGAGELMSRDSTEMPWEHEKDTLRKYDSYNFDMILQLLLRKELQAFAGDYYASSEKWTKPSMALDYIKLHLRAIQRFPDGDMNILNKIVRRILSWTRPNIFMHPYRGARNIVQPAWSSPYRRELIRLIIDYKKIPASDRHIFGEYSAVRVDQSETGIPEWMFQGEDVSVFGEIPPWLEKALFVPGLVPRALDFLAHQTGKIRTMAVSDKLSRSPAFMSFSSKAWRATEQYKKDKNAKKWFDDSGINNGYITEEQQNHILGLLALGEEIVSQGIPGLTEVSGYMTANFKIAEETTNRTLYLYDKSLAAGVHRGSGRIVGSLLIFARSTAQMYGLQLQRVFRKESTKGERLASVGNIVALWIYGDLLSSLLMTVFGKERKEYSIVNTLSWSFGGLAWGVALDVSNFLIDISLGLMGEEEDRERVLARFPGELARLGDVLVGFWEILSDTVEALGDEPGTIESILFNKIRAIIDKDYTPEEREKAKMSILEKAQKILAGSEPPDPDFWERAQETLRVEEDRLGEIVPELMGKPYTVKQFGGKIDSVLDLKSYEKGIPDYLITEEAEWSDLVLFRAYGYNKWREYDILPTSVRIGWRESHLEEEAMMLFWGKVARSRFRVGTPEGEEIMKLLRFWWAIYGITRDERPKATWEDGGKVAGTE